MISDSAILNRMHLEYLALRNRAEHIAELAEKKKYPEHDVSTQVKRATEMKAAIERFCELSGEPLPHLRAQLGLSVSEKDAA